MKDRFNLRLYSKKRHEYVYINTISYEDGKISYIDILDPSNELYAIEISVNDLGKDYALEQCTGLKDKYGNLIYEGDILQSTDGFFHQKYKVKWDREFSQFTLIGINTINTAFGIIAPDSLEIIGNIHENPELLEGNNG